MSSVTEHYDTLIDEDNDPICDPPPLKEYMDKWDGQRFIESLQILKSDDVLEIGVGTGRIAIRVCGSCNCFCGIDISPKTIKRAREHLEIYKNCNLVCADFLDYIFDKEFDVIYSTLTFIHIKDKQSAINKASALLKDNGRFVLSMSKDQDRKLEMNGRTVELFPATTDEIKEIIIKSGLSILEQYETEFAFITVAVKSYK